LAQFVIGWAAAWIQGFDRQAKDFFQLEGVTKFKIWKWENWAIWQIF
jgi:hypothetical protein